MKVYLSRYTGFCIARAYVDCALYVGYVGHPSTDQDALDDLASKLRRDDIRPDLSSMVDTDYRGKKKGAAKQKSRL